jgi:ribosomal protein S18 acetylase RimI-like enzyme
MQNIIYKRAIKEDSTQIAVLVGELLNEIMTRIDIKAFNFNLEETILRLEDFIEKEKNYIFIAKDKNEVIGFITAYEGFALYTEGAFGTIAELYIKPTYRSSGIGKELINKLSEFSNSKNWTRLEVTTPPLPQFDETLAFYEREGFEISGGRKLKRLV